MLARRIIPCLDIAGGRVVKGRKFVDLQDVGDPVSLAERYDDEGADELTLLDISASREGRATFLSVVESVARTIMIPFTVGGGIRSVDDIRRALRAGADKVSLNTSIVRDPDLLARASACIGSQSIVAAIDVCRGEKGWIVRIGGGSEPTGLDAVAWAVACAEAGAGELLVTSMDRDGTREGYDLDLLQAITSAVNIPVIASGGAGTVRHVFEAVSIGGADAVLAAGIFHDGTLALRDLKHGLDTMYGVPVRL